MASHINHSPSEHATRRAAKADPNERRCLIRNCPSSPDNPVVAVNVFSKKYYSIKKTMQTIEWSWKMKIGTLNLDTRENTMFLSDDLKDWFEKGQCFLVPDQRVVSWYEYKRRWGGMEARSWFPKIQEPVYTYTFIALSTMADVVIKRYDGGEMTEHTFPFTTLPPITSHIHPKFAILHCGLACRRLIDDDRKRLYHSNYGKSLDTCHYLALSWTALIITKWVKDHDRTYEDGFGGDDDHTEVGSDSDSTVSLRPRATPFFEESEDEVNEADEDDRE